MIPQSSFDQYHILKAVCKDSLKAFYLEISGISFNIFLIEIDAESRAEYRGSLNVQSKHTLKQALISASLSRLFGK